MFLSEIHIEETNIAKIYLLIHFLSMQIIQSLANQLTEVGVAPVRI